MAGLFVKKGDTVRIVGGKSKGLQGKVISADPDSSRVLVEGVNQVKRHTRPVPGARGNTAGGIVTQEAPVHVSNVQVVCPACGKATRVGHRKDTDANGKARSVRVCKHCDGDI